MESQKTLSSVESAEKLVFLVRQGDRGGRQENQASGAKLPVVVEDEKEGMCGENP